MGKGAKGGYFGVFFSCFDGQEVVVTILRGIFRGEVTKRGLFGGAFWLFLG